MTTRRAFLSACTAASAAALAGCTSSAEGPSVVCTTTGGSDGGDVFDGPPAVSSAGQEWLVLFVPIRRSALEATDVERVLVSQRGELVHELPVRSIETAHADREDEDPFVVQQTLGRVPGAGRLAVEAVDAAGEVLHAEEVVYSCHRRDLDAPSF